MTASEEDILTRFARLNNPSLHWSTIDKGSFVEVMLKSGRIVKGTLYSQANHYGTDGWYIEIVPEHGGYIYWKQGSDGGVLTAVDSKGYHPVENGVMQ